VIVDLDSLLGHHHTPGGLGGAGPLSAEVCRRLACDGALTRGLVTRHPGPPLENNPLGARDLAGWLQTAMALLPPVLGGAPSQPLDVGRASRVITPAQRTALAVRDGGCVFPDRTRPVSWCEGHHLWHWVDGGPTDLANLALVCRAHHRAVHDGGWQLTRTRRPLHRHPTASTTPRRRLS
jgi:HNH endonuclease